jgi:hypothetical protein
MVVYHIQSGDIHLHPRGLEFVLSLRQEAVDGVLQFILVAMAPRSDGLWGGISHNITDRCFEGWLLMPAEDPRPREDLCNCLEFHPPWTQDSLDLISWGRGDAQVSQQGTKPAGGDWCFSTEWFTFVSISVQLLPLVVTQGRILFIVFVFIFIVDVVVLLLLLLLSRWALSCRATMYH